MTVQEKYGNSTPSNVQLIIGNIGSGKSSLACHLIDNVCATRARRNKVKNTEIIILTGSMNDKYFFKYGMNKHYEKCELSFDALLNISNLCKMKMQYIENPELFNLEEMPPLQKKIFENDIILMCDDLLSYEASNPKTLRLIKHIVFNSRHLFIGVIFMLQHIQELPTGITSESDYVYIKRVLTQNIKVILNRFIDLPTKEVKQQLIDLMREAFIKDNYFTFRIDTKKNLLSEYKFDW